MRKVWGLYSLSVDLYNNWELIEIFEDGRRANQVRDLLIGKLVDQHGSFVWHDSVDQPGFNSLYVFGLAVR